MSISSKVAIAVDLNDWNKIDLLVSNIIEGHEIHDVHTPDNTYRCVYWDDVCWGTAATHALEKTIGGFRHAFVEITEEGKIKTECVDCDDRGCDEEFYELLSWTADICFWEDGAPLTPISRSGGTWHKSYVPISRERAIQILTAYVENDVQAAETGYIYDALTQAGADHREIEALGFGYCIPEEDSSCVKAGDRIRLIHMEDKFAPPDGTMGTVTDIDDIGTIHVNWDTGSTLGLVPNVDKFEILSKEVRS